VKLNELEKVINQYQEKLNDVTQSYQQKIGILENKIIDKELEKGYTMNNHVEGNEDDYSSHPTRTSESMDFSDFSPERNPPVRSHLNSAKSIDVIREESFEEEDDTELLKLGI